MRSTIVDAVVDMIDELGWEQVTVRRIGDRMHYAASTIVYHLGSFDELTTAVRIKVGQQVIGALFDGDTEGPGRFDQAAARVLAWSRAHPNLHRFFVTQSADDQALRAVNESVPMSWAPPESGWPPTRVLQYFDRSLRCALEGALLLEDDHERQHAFLATEVAHLDAQWHRLVIAASRPVDSLTE